MTAHGSLSPQLSLFRFRGPWPGAGRPPGPNPRVRHQSRPDFPGRFPAHVTLKVRRGLRTLRDVRIVRALEATLAEACERGDFRVTQYAIQPDHLHLVVEASDRAALGRGMKAIGARIARAVNRVLGRRGRVLRDRYHLRVLETPREVRRALNYVLNNARKHLGARAPRVGRVDPASSGRWFSGWREGVVALARSPAPVARARTWLLRVGWQRHRLLDPSEVPGPRAP
jgi:REP element-mobilizing transposase RayT